MAAVRQIRVGAPGNERQAVVGEVANQRLVHAAVRGGSAAGHLIQVMRGHLVGRDHGVMDPAPALYAIPIRGQLRATVLSAFPAPVPRPPGTPTRLPRPLS